MSVSLQKEEILVCWRTAGPGRGPAPSPRGPVRASNETGGARATFRPAGRQARRNPSDRERSTRPAVVADPSVRAIPRADGPSRGSRTTKGCSSGKMGPGVGNRRPMPRRSSRSPCPGGAKSKGPPADSGAVSSRGVRSADRTARAGRQGVDRRSADRFPAATKNEASRVSHRRRAGPGRQQSSSPETASMEKSRRDFGIQGVGESGPALTVGPAEHDSLAGTDRPLRESAVLLPPRFASPG